MTTAFVPNEGEALMADMVMKLGLTDRDATLKLGLFTNDPTTLGEATVLADMVPPTGGGYAPKTLTDASWTGAADTRSYAKQTFTATGGNYSAPIFGYYVYTVAAGGTPRLLCFEVDPNAGTVGAPQFPMHENDTYDVTPNVVFA